MTVYTVAGGKAQSHWQVLDWVCLYQQLGLAKG